MSINDIIDDEVVDDVLYDCRAGDLPSLKEFISKFGVNPLGQIKDQYTGNTPLHMASANGHLDIVDYLIQEIKSENELLQTLVNGVNESGNSPLHWAALNGHLEVVQSLCDAGAQPFVKNKAGRDVFFEAEANEKEQVMEYLLGRYAVEDNGEEEDDGDVSGAAKEVEGLKIDQV